MKGIIEKNIARYKDPVKRRNVLREELQHLVLKILDDGGWFRDISFVGGTALRVLYGLRRFSEDMDFSLQRPGDPSFDFQKLLDALARQLHLFRLPVDTKVKRTGAVHSVFLRFKGLLQEFDIVARRGQKLSVKVEIDTNPPPHARFESRLLQRDYLFTVVHHDLPTLFAGKSMAFLNRSYTKGRDLYDMIWFATRGIEMNMPFFTAGLRQSSGSDSSWTQDELRKRLVAKLLHTDMRAVIADVMPFLDDDSEIRFFDATLIRPLFEAIRFEDEGRNA